MDKHYHGDNSCLMYLRVFLSLTYVNGMTNGLKNDEKLLAVDTSIFSIVKNKNVSAKDLSHDLSLISKWDFKWKVLF